MFFKENIYTKHARIEVKHITATMVKIKATRIAEKNNRRISIELKDDPIMTASRHYFFFPGLVSDIDRVG